jgi:uncharacterized protein (TIGR02246 family)
MTVAALALAALSGCAATAREAYAPAAEDSAPPAPAEISRFFADYFRAVEAGAPEGILALIDSDFVIRWGGRPIQDRRDLQALLERLQRSVRQEIEWDVLEGRVAGDWAWARVREKSTHHSKIGGELRVFEGTHLVILRRTDGRWRMHRNHGMLDQPPAAR